MELTSAKQVTRANQAEALAALLSHNPSFPDFAKLACRVVVMEGGVLAIPVTPAMLIRFENFSDDDEFIEVGDGEAFTFQLAPGEAELDAKFVSERMVKVFQEHSLQLDGAVQSVQIATLSDLKVFDQFPEAENMSEVLNAILKDAIVAEMNEANPIGALMAMLNRR